MVKCDFICRLDQHSLKALCEIGTELSTNLEKINAASSYTFKIKVFGRFGHQNYLVKFMKRS